jgi:hypothetical protein
MARYYFHVRDGGNTIEDQDGIELSGLEAAASQCRRIIEEVLGEDAFREEVGVSDRQFEIVDALGRPVLTVPFRESENAAGRPRRRLVGRRP